MVVAARLSLIAVLWAGYAGPVRAQEAAPPVPWELDTDTSTVATPSTPGAARVERRVMRKKNRFAIRTGATYLAREDFYETPGLAFELSWYPHEWFAVDVTGSAYFASLNSTAADLRRRLGLLPDSQKPLGQFMVGGRFAFAYGKFLIETLGVVMHADASVTAHAGGLVTDQTINFVGDVSLAGQVRLDDHFVVWLDIGWLLGFERRSASNFMAGPRGSAGIGVLL